jgi:hypothetical protein
MPELVVLYLDLSQTKVAHDSFPVFFHLLRIVSGLSKKDVCIRNVMMNLLLRFEEDDSYGKGIE